VAPAVRRARGQDAGRGHCGGPEPRHPALALPGLQGAHRRLAERAGGELGAAQGPLRQLRDAHLAALSGGRARHRRHQRAGRLALRVRLRGGLRDCSHVVPGPAHRHRHRHPAAAGHRDPAVAVARAAGKPVARPDFRLRAAGQPARCHHRGRRRVPVPVGRVPRLQAADRQGGHGLRRLQALCRARGLDGLADAAADPAALGRRGRRGRHRADRRPRSRAGHSHPLRAVSRRRRVHRHAVGPTDRGGLPGRLRPARSPDP